MKPFRLYALTTALAAAAALALVACNTGAAPAPGASRAPHQTQGHGKMCGGIGGLQCGAGDYCRMTPPIYPDKGGVCTTKPDMCPMIYKPVCGMDAKTYPNACHAAQAGASVEAEGACKA